jgi:hypothetical protein
MDLNALSKKITKAVDLRKTLEFKGISFEIGLLTADEERKVNSLIEDIREDESVAGLSDRMDNLKRITAAYGVRAIDGEEVPPTLEMKVEGSEETRMIPRAEALADHLREWPGSVTLVLYSAVADLRTEASKNLEADIKYEWFEAPDLLEDDEEEEAALAEAGSEDSPEEVVLQKVDEKDAQDTEKALEALGEG